MASAVKYGTIYLAPGTTSTVEPCMHPCLSSCVRLAWLQARAQPILETRRKVDKPALAPYNVLFVEWYHGTGSPHGGLDIRHQALQAPTLRRAVLQQFPRRWQRRHKLLCPVGSAHGVEDYGDPEIRFAGQKLLAASHRKGRFVNQTHWVSRMAAELHLLPSLLQWQA